MVYKIINEIANALNKEILISAHTRTKSKHGHNFFIMTKITNEYKYSFFPQTISQWNSLPKSYVDSESLDAFKYGFKDLKSLP